MRKEKDMLGEMLIPDEAYYGIHTARALENFHITGRHIHPELIKALVMVKKAAAITNAEVGLLDKNMSNAICGACDEIISGSFMEQFVVDPLQGGAGTSANMNVNEVIANRAIELLGGNKGDYSIVDPLDHVNMSQSTNDVFPTAVRIASIKMLKPVSELFSQLQTALQEKEEEFSTVIKVGRTQLQDAVPVLLGQEFGAWAQAISRDRWRIYKVEERLRQVNIGGTAVGTGMNADRKYIFLMVEKLRALTGIGLARAEYMMDPTQNNDVFVEVSGLLKTSCVNLSKIANDLRLMASGPRAGLGEIALPPVQAGSSIMPGKVNPVIPEAINQIAFQVMGNDLTITMAAQSGQLELNAFLPVIAHNLLEMLDILRNGIEIFINKCIKGIAANRKRCREMMEESYVQVPALIRHIGYGEASNLAKECVAENKKLRDILIEKAVLDSETIDKILNPLELTKPGIPGMGKR
ncbi:aspartate ammonia-lyase [Pseudobacteroides cellulosolvens]|uniref:Aspartate ammonia-lyase n=1 Tax=Pseudobacteroides cellulosolvens ATCC 35603 = DSM 2933 TaxID=398512 RepID=A0A0L6JI58_9FIRM|nr:aspartate ammonia-lyase [Pseudobacteroides cellulosolvens]KNY25400.1 Aspartate ammonia-lyase [Pseudobacteroides cellulosolvens ATCC 35603 = DSM 2933]